MDEQRPDPDLLLRQVQQEEALARQGNLKVFLGYAPGVGKTYAMLETAWQRKLDGVDVVAGYVETHGRFETNSLLAGLEILPRAETAYQGLTLTEMDLDAVLARKPQIALVDELAHTNAPGCRHRKRWQDVFELLDAGIDVYTTLNVQHLESLIDVVRQITGVKVRETLPDSVLDRADEIELVDLPPDELLRRLQEGKVYLADLATAARENYFRQGNLIALRELSLRRAAERVDAQMQSYRRAKGVREIWPASERILVCIGANPRSIRLIRAAKRMAAGLRADWLAVHVEAPAKVRPKESDLRQLAEHMRLAESLGAETVTLSGHNASDEILNYARSRNVTKIIIGKPTHPRWKDRLFGSVLDQVVRGSGDIDVNVITGDSGEPPLPQMRREPAPWRPREWIWSIAGVGAATVVSLLLLPYVGVVDVVMIYLLGVVITASRSGKWPSLLATFLSVATFNFFFIPPRFTLNVADVRYLFTFSVMFFVAYVICRLTLQVRNQAEAARIRERRTATLYILSRELAHERGVDTLAALAVKQISELFASQVVILVPDAAGELAVPGTGPGTFALDAREMGVAKWVFDHGQRAGHGTDTLPGAQALYLPLAAATRTMGVLGILPATVTVPFDHEQIQSLENFVSLTAMAIERAFLAEEAQRALLKAEAEALRNTLLSAVSHDLRTPLAAITGAATSLLQESSLDDAGRRELTQTICEESEHLNRLIRNILDMTRLESGTIQVAKEWQSLEEIVGVVFNRLADQLAGRPVETRLPPDVPLLQFDPLLIEQVLTNLLENALKYTPQGTPLELSAAVKDKAVEVTLADRGPGLPPGSEERIFEKFVRGTGSGRGVGLGLAICRAIIAAHGGRIQAENRPGGGAVFRFTLPLRGEPPRVEPEDEI